MHMVYISTREGIINGTPILTRNELFTVKGGLCYLLIYKYFVFLKTKSVY